MTARWNTALTLGLVSLIGASSLAIAAPGGARDGDRAEMREEMFNRLDTDGDGQFTREDLEGQAEIRFQDNDTNGDGFLSAGEIKTATEKRLSERAERMSARMLERLDRDEDGQLSLEEATADGKRGDRMFERADANGDGVITRAEFMSAERPQGRFHRDGRQ
ncbi:MAG: EF-hand domain-containing protein [Dinoroseobacter sp.]|nr:EF-hand domain-containing protein [Dinoroseobacter sp.]